MKHESRRAARLALVLAMLGSGSLPGALATSPATYTAPARALQPAAASSSPASSSPATTSPSLSPSLEARLAWLQDQLEKRRTELNIPGMSFALVQDDKVVLSRGFGVSDVVSKAPVTDDSLFDIGSSTKAFTAMLCAMMVDEGKMDFDKPVTTYMPDFKLHTPEWTASTTLRDALAHRTGLTRTDMMWAGNKVSRKEAIAQLRFAESFAPPRTAFLYNNMMFAVAGDAAALVAGEQSWESMVTDRIFKPLGMNGSTPFTSKAKDDPRLALGYAFDKSTGEYRRLPMRMLDACAPAGSICSTARDMSSWVRFMLNKGEYNGNRLIKASFFDADLWAPQMPMTPTSSYGLGWMIDKWKDKRVVHHGGNIDGYAAMVALLPDDRAGLVLLTNVTATALQEECKTLAWTALFGSANDFKPASDHPNAKTELQLEPYVGKYDFALQQSQMTTLVKDGKLCVDVPGQTVYALKWPNEKGRWVFELTDAIEVDFQAGDDGKMKSMTLYQAGQTFVMPREGTPKPVAAPAPGALTAEQLRPYLGKFDFPVQKSQVTALIRDGKLALDVPGQMVYTLKWPNEKGRWVFELTDAIEVDFQPGDDGVMKSMTMYQAGQVFPMPRLAVEVGGMPTAAELTAIIQKSRRGPAPGSFRLTGTVNMVHQGLSGPCVIVCDGEKYLMRLDLGKFGYVTSGYDGAVAYSDSNIGESKILTGEEAAQTRSMSPRSLVDDPSRFYETMEPQAWDTIAGTKCVKTAMTAPGAPTTTVWYAFDTGRPIKEELHIVQKDVGMNIRLQVDYAQFKPLGNVDFPSVMTMENPMQGRMVLTFDKLEADIAIDPAELALPASLKK